jgi:hypothetical protein
VTPWSRHSSYTLLEFTPFKAASWQTEHPNSSSPATSGSIHGCLFLNSLQFHHWIFKITSLLLTKVQSSIKIATYLFHSNVFCLNTCNNQYWEGLHQSPYAYDIVNILMCSHAVHTRPQVHLNVCKHNDKWCKRLIMQTTLNKNISTRHLLKAMNISSQWNNISSAQSVGTWIYFATLKTHNTYKRPKLLFRKTYNPQKWCGFHIKSKHD